MNTTDGKGDESDPVSLSSVKLLTWICIASVLSSLAIAGAPTGLISESASTAMAMVSALVTLVGLLLLLVRFSTFNRENHRNVPAPNKTDVNQTNPSGIDRLDASGTCSSFEAASYAPKPRVLQSIKTASDASNVVELSHTDQLTGLGNRQRLVQKFQKLINDSDGAPSFSVGILDLDGMKPINDLFGYDGGDHVLKQCGTRLARAVEGDGYVMRYGGDEFAFIFPNLTSEEDAEQRGRLLQDILNAPFDLDGNTVRLSGSFGFALVPHAGTEFHQVVESISSALYYSKKGGRGKVTVYTKEISELILENARIEQALRKAIDNNQVTPHYQPIISLQDGRLLGFESLARWIDKDLGFVSPAKFIPLAEERGFIAPLTENLLMQAAQCAAKWPEELFLSFNLSSVQLVDPTTADTILSVIKRAGLDPKRLEIEVTETAMMSDPEIAEAIIEQLHKAGIRISMDDFGTGQSSLGRLRELKLDKVKIDRAFIMAIGEDKPAEHIVRAILEMCAGLELTVVAEGIEELAQAESLKSYGCQAGQGYLFGKPQDEQKTLGYIREFVAQQRHDQELAAAG